MGGGGAGSLLEWCLGAGCPHPPLHPRTIHTVAVCSQHVLGKCELRVGFSTAKPALWRVFYAQRSAPSDRRGHWRSDPGPDQDCRSLHGAPAGKTAGTVC